MIWVLFWPIVLLYAFAVFLLIATLFMVQGPAAILSPDWSLAIGLFLVLGALAIAVWYVLIFRPLHHSLAAIQDCISQLRAGNLSARTGLPSSGLLSGFAQHLDQALDSLEPQYEERLSEKQDLGSIINHIPAAIIVSDSEYNLCISNTYAERILMVSNDQAKGKRVLDVLRLQKVFDYLSQSDDSVFVQELSLDDRSNIIYEIQSTLLPEIPGRPPRLLSLIQDVSRRDELKKQHYYFLGLISHELRTPLSTVIGYLDLLKSGSKAPESSDHVQVIYDHSQRLKSLVDDLLVLTSIDNTAPVQNESIDVLALVQDLLSDLKVEAEKRGNTVDLDCTERLDMISSDREILAQMLGKLLLNAIFEELLQHTIFFLHYIYQSYRKLLQDLLCDK